MNTPAADDYTAIKARMEEIERERANAPTERAMQTAVGQYLAGCACGSLACINGCVAKVDKPKQIQHQTYMGWDIYPPHTP